MSPGPKPRSLWDRVTRKDVFARWSSYARRDIWHVELATLPTFRALLTRVSRVVLLSVRGFRRDKCMQQAAALTYITIFSLVPLLVFMFAVARGIGLFTMLERDVIGPFLDDTFGPRGAPGESGTRVREVVDLIFDFVKEPDLKAVTALGVVFLVYSGLKLLGAIERTLNGIWGIARPRTLVRRVSDFLAIAVVTPLFLVVGATLTTLIKQDGVRLIPGLPHVDLSPLLNVIPFMSVWFGLSFIYVTLPNTRVPPLSALIGGFVAGLLWQLVQMLLIELQIGVTRYEALYSTFAALPLFLLWIYLSWQILLLGAEVAFAHQNEPVYASIARTGTVDQAFREALAPRLAGRVAHAFVFGKPPPTTLDLATDLGVSPRAVSGVLDILVDRDLLARTDVGEDDGYLPARDPDGITVVDLLVALRTEPGAGTPASRTKLDQRVDRILRAMEDEQRASLHNHTLRELARIVAEEGEPEPADTRATRAAEHPST